MIFNIPELYKQRRTIKKMRRFVRASAQTRSLSVLLAIALIVTGTFGGYFSLHAAVSTRRAPLVFQGRISDANYVPVADTSSRNMVFRIWNASTAGTCLWITGTGTSACTATANADGVAVATTITRGIFTVPLGDTAVANMPALDQDFDNQTNQVYYLSISVKNDSGTYEDLSPRIRISAAPYAYNADELDGKTSASFAQLAGQAGGQALIGGTATTDDLTLRTTSGVGASGADMIFQVGNNGATEAMRILNSGFIGIGITTPTAYVHMVQPTATSGSPTALTVTGASHTGLASSEVTDANFNFSRTITFTGNAAALINTQRSLLVQPPTFTASGALQPIYTGATFAVSGVPTSNSSAGFDAPISLPVGVLIEGRNLTQGSFLLANFPSEVTLSGQIFGIYEDLSTNLTINSGTLNGYYMDLGSATNNTASALTMRGFYLNASTKTITNSGASSSTWEGLNVAMPNITRTAGTLTSTGIAITGGTITGSATSYAMTTDGAAGNVGIGTATPASFLTVTQPVVTTGSPTALTVTGGSHTTLTASTESTDINFNLNREIQFATGALATQRAVRIQAPTYGFVGASTITNAATLSIEDLPKAGTNATITNRIGIRISPSTSSSSTYYGEYNDMGGLALSAGNDSFNILANTPTVSNGGATNTNTYGLFVDGFQDASVRLLHTAGAGTDSWYGLRVWLPQQAQAAGTVISRGVSIERLAPATGGTSYALTTNTDAGNVGLGTLTPDTMLDLAGTLSFTPSATQSITGVGSSILANSTFVTIDPDGNYTLTSAPTIADGAIGQIVYIHVMTGEANTVTIQDQSASGVLTNVELAGNANRTMGANDVLALLFNGNDWVEISYSNN